MSMTTHLDPAYCERLAADVLRGDATAWRLLVETLWPHLLRQITARRSGRARGSEDDARNIATSVLEKLRRDDHHALRQYFEWRHRKPDKTFLDWLFIVSTNAARDHSRAELGRARGDGAEPDGAASGRGGGRAATSDTGRDKGSAIPSVKRFLNEISASGILEEQGFRPPITTHQTARQVLELAERKLDRDQHEALELWLQGHDAADIAAGLGLEGAESATRLVRAAIAVLRRAFGAPTF